MFDPQKKKSWRTWIGNIYLIEIHRKNKHIKAMCKKGYSVMGFVWHKTSWKLQKKHQKTARIRLDGSVCFGTKGVRGRVDSIKRVAPWQLSRNRQGHKCLAPLVQHRFDEYSPRPGNRSVIDWSDLGCRVSQRVQEMLLESQKWKSTRRSWVAHRRCTAL